MHTFHTTRRIEFADTDMAGIVHFARFFVFMETAEHELLRALGAPAHCLHEGREIAWPRGTAACRYLAPVRYGDLLEITVRVRRKGRSSMTYDFDFHCNGTTVARARATTVCCVLATRNSEPQVLKSIPIPSFLADQIEEAPPDPAFEAMWSDLGQPPPPPHRENPG